MLGQKQKNFLMMQINYLDKVINEKLLTANGVVGLFPANSVGVDDIEIYTDETRTRS